MKKKIFCLLLVVFLITACGKVPKLENGQEAIVSFNDNKMISVDDFYNEIKDQYGLSILVKMMDTQVLTTLFPDYADTAKEKAADLINSYRDQFSSETEFVQAIQSYTGFSSIELYQSYMELSYYEEYATEQYIKENLTDKQIEKYYKDEIKGDIEISHILIIPDVTSNMTDSEKAEKETEALNTANKILRELKETKSADLVTKFGELAKKYSEDETTKDKNGELGQVNISNTTSPYKPLIDAAYSIKDGEYYTKVVKSNYGYHIVLRNKSYEKPSLESSRDKIVEALVSKEKESNSTVTINAMQHYRNKVGATINDSKLNSKFNDYVTSTLANALNS